MEFKWSMRKHPQTKLYIDFKKYKCYNIDIILNYKNCRSEIMAHVFISYSSKDIKKADAFRSVFNINGIKTWMAPYDVPSGCRYAEAITDAIEHSDCFCLLLSKASQESDQVDSEVNLAKGAEIPFIIVQIEDVAINKAFKYYITNKHIEKILDVNADSPEMQKVIDAVRKHTDAEETETVDVLTQTAIPMQTITYESGSFYTGETLNGLRHGKGKYVWPDGEYYEGEWANGVRHGKGKLCFSNGNTYVGDFTEDTITGKGRMEYHDGRVYDGDWVNGIKHGKGKLTCPDGKIYDGDWEDDDMTGKTHFVNPGIGVIYDGEVLKGRMHGKGRLTYSDGRVFEGEWENDKFIG